MHSDNRPLSPHLQIYKLPLTAITSITHRITGAALALGLVLVVYWLAAAATGPVAYGQAQAVLGSFLGQIILFVFTFSLFYHLANGIRHLVWDTGAALDLESARLGSYLVLAAAAALTVILWVFAYLA